MDLELQSRARSLDLRYLLDYRTGYTVDQAPIGHVELRARPGDKIVATLDVSGYYVIQAVPVGLDIEHRDAFLIVTQGGGGRYFRTRVILPKPKGFVCVFDQTGQGKGFSTLPEISSLKGNLALGIEEKRYVWDPKAGRFRLKK